jgi:predicted MFS family arabinose efflux permease
LAAVAIWVCVSRSPVTYALAVPVISIAALFLMPYIQGVLSFVDPSGKLNAGSSAFMTLGGALGPLLGGTLIARGGFATLGACAAVLFTVVFGLFRPAARAHDATVRAR